jgi:biotin transport system substrate-specific component
MSTGVSSPASPSTLVGQLWPARDETRFAVIRAALLVMAGVALLIASAKIQVPFYPVPMTLQTLAVLLIGATYGWRLGGLTVALYIAQGAAGVPVFAGPVAGAAYLAGPTGGFIIGFFAAAVVTGYLAERGWDRSLLSVIAMMTIGHAVNFAFGLGWLTTLMPISKAWAVGAAPFMLATLLKTALAVAAMRAAWTFAGREGSAR